MKYIDSEKLTAEIEGLIEEVNIQSQKSIRPQYSLFGKINGLELALNLVRSLQQEEPKAGLDVTEFCQPVPKNIADCTAEHFWEMLGDEEKERPEDLEKFIGDFFNKKDAENNGRWSEDDIVEAITRAFELGRAGKKE